MTRTARGAATVPRASRWRERGRMPVVLIAAAALVALAPLGARAALMTYTDAAAFNADLPGPATTLDFEGQVGGDTSTFGDLILDGDTLAGITFNYPVLAGFGVTMEVRKDNDTTSGANALGTDDGGVFLDGDVFDLSFGPVNAIGMFFITPDFMLDDDITLSAGGGSVGLLASGGSVLPDGGQAFFLGLIDDMNTFTAASIVADGGPGGPFFVYTVDDITTAAVPVVPVPEPGSLPLLAVGLAGLWLTARRRRDGA